MESGSWEVSEARGRCSSTEWMLRHRSVADNENPVLSGLGARVPPTPCSCSWYGSSTPTVAQKVRKPLPPTVLSTVRGSTYVQTPPALRRTGLDPSMHVRTRYVIANAIGSSWGTNVNTRLAGAAGTLHGEGGEVSSVRERRGRERRGRERRGRERRGLQACTYAGSPTEARQKYGKFGEKNAALAAWSTRLCSLPVSPARNTSMHAPPYASPFRCRHQYRTPGAGLGARGGACCATKVCVRRVTLLAPFSLGHSLEKLYVASAPPSVQAEPKPVFWFPPVPCPGPPFPLFSRLRTPF